MRRPKLTRARQERFLKALADTGNVTAAVAVAGTSRTRVYEFRKTDTAFAADWDEAEEIATDRLEDEARRRAIEGVAEPLVSAGKLVRGDDGQPVTVRRYSDNLLLALLKARRLPRRERSVRFQLPALRSADDAVSAMAALTAAVTAGKVTPGEAVEMSRLVEAYIRALEAASSIKGACVGASAAEVRIVQSDGLLRGPNDEIMTADAFEEARSGKGVTVILPDNGRGRLRVDRAE
jgi:hypothetical protein